MAAQKPVSQLRFAGGIWYECVRRKNKKLHLHVQKDGSVKVTIPMRTDWTQADRFVEEQIDWIRERQVKELAQNRDLPDKETAVAYFTAMSDKVYPVFAQVLGGKKPTIKVRSMTTRWGVCFYNRGQITFALQLYNMPPAAQIYVVVHEYCHFLHHDHSPAFWAEVEKILPDWRARRELLK